MRSLDGPLLPACTTRFLNDRFGDRASATVGLCRQCLETCRWRGDLSGGLDDSNWPGLWVRNRAKKLPFNLAG